MTTGDLVLHIRNMEKNIINHSQVEDAVIITVENHDGSNILKVFVEPSAEDDQTKETIKQYCLEQAGDMQMEVYFKEIPRTPSGKVNRQQLLDAVG